MFKTKRRRRCWGSVDVVRRGVKGIEDLSLRRFEYGNLNLKGNTQSELGKYSEIAGELSLVFSRGHSLRAQTELLRWFNDHLHPSRPLCPLPPTLLLLAVVKMEKIPRDNNWNFKQIIK